MAAGNVNLLMGCEDCRFADAHGRDCKHGMLFPVLALMAGYSHCPNYEAKTTEQIEEQIRLRHERD